MPKGAKVQLEGIKLLDLAQAQKERLGMLMELTDPQIKRIKKRLRKEIENWLEETEELHRILEEDNDLVEGIYDDSQALWDGAFVTHIPITGTYMAIYRSVARRSILAADVIWYGELIPGTKETIRPVLTEVEEMMNYKARKEWNISDCLSDVIWATCRDKLGILQVVYAEEYELVSDIALITSLEDFIEEFPTPEEAGLSEAEYQEALAQVESQASDEAPIEIPYTAEKIKYQGPKGYVVDLVNFPVFPPTVSDIKSENCRGYGKRFPLRKGVVRQRSKDGVWYKKAVNNLLKKGEGASETPAFILAQEEIEGFSRSDVSQDFWFYELVYKMDLGENGKATGDTERRFLFTYNFDHDELVGAMEYPYRVLDHYATFRIGSRPNRLLGESIPQMTRELNFEIDFQHQQRNNSRTITSVPSFKMKKGTNEDFDPLAEENQWRPGVIFELEDPDSFDQFKVQPVDLGESMAEEANNMKILDLRTGAAASVLSGGVAPGDPSAPGNKTQMQIGQSNLRMDDPISELRRGVEEVGDICLSHEYQFGPMFIQFEMEIEGQKVMRTLHKKFLRGIRMRMSAVTATNNPDAEFARAMQMYAMASKDPIVAQDDEVRYEILRNAFRRGRISNREKMLPPLQVVRQRMVERQKVAMQQMAIEKQMAAKKAKEQAIKERLQEAKTSLHLRKTARDIAEKGLGLKRVAPKAKEAAGVR